VNGGWFRLEGSNRSPILEPGLQAPVADALWMLARQWQVGEFRGEDAGRPVRARYAVERVAMDHFFEDPAEVTVQGARPITDLDGPIEVYVERESITTGPAAFAFSAEAGVQLLRFLRSHGVSRKTGNLIARTHSLSALPGLNATKSVLATRAPDGAAAYRKRSGLHLLAGIPESERASMQVAVTAWAEWYAQRLDEPETEASDSSPMWREDRQAYRFALAAKPDKQSAIILTADDHAGGRLDWHAFDLSKRRLTELPTSQAEVQSHVLHPTPVSFGGMAAPRWWTFEPGEVHFAGINSGPSEITRMVVAEFATVYSNDYWMLPVGGRTGHLQRITSLEVIDSFGDVHRIPAAAAVDADTGRRPWRFMELTGDPSADTRGVPWLALINTTFGATESTAVERVEFVRDEQSNLGWAGEVTYERNDGTYAQRMDEWRAVAAEVVPLEETTSEGAWSYRLNGTMPPPHWVPLVPMRPDETSPQVELRRGRLREWDLLPEGVRRLRGLILTPDSPFAIDEVELPPSGLTVTRTYHTARDRTGRIRQWVGRRRILGRGERTLGTRSDRIIDTNT